MLAEAGLTTTEATGTEVTVIADVPLFPSLVAVIVADPGATPLTSPVASTVAVATALVVQAMARPVSTLPLASSVRSEEHTSELQSLAYLVCRLLLEKKKKKMT